MLLLCSATLLLREMVALPCLAGTLAGPVVRPLERRLCPTVLAVIVVAQMQRPAAAPEFAELPPDTEAPATAAAGKGMMTVYH